MAMRWRWPPESLTPRSPTWASKPRRPCQSSRRLDELERMGAGGGVAHFRIARARPAIADVVADRAVQQRGVLGHHGDMGAQALLRHPGDVLAVDQDAARLDLVEAQQQVDQGRFAGARVADEADALARRDGEVDAMQHARARCRSRSAHPRSAPRRARPGGSPRPAGPASGAARRSSACRPGPRRRSRRSPSRSAPPSRRYWRSARSAAAPWRRCPRGSARRSRARWPPRRCPPPWWR